MNMREKLARALCEADGHDPDQLEPGDDPYMNNTEFIDGYNRKGEPCHFFWRHYDRGQVDAVLEAMMEPDEGMLDEFARAFGWQPFSVAGRENARAAVRAMLTAARSGA